MRERPYLDEHSDVVTAGLLAEDVVFAASTLKAGKRLGREDSRALKSARDLLAYISAPGGQGEAQERIGSLTGTTGALEALRVVESQRPPTEVRKYLEGLITLIDESLAGENVSSRASTLDSLQKLFAAISDVALARSNSLAAAANPRPLWHHATTISAS